jgi:hypothetical protein
MMGREHLCARLLRCAYYDRDGIADLGFAVVSELNVGFVQATLVEGQGQVVLVIPGTNDGALEWIFTNFACWSWQRPDGTTCHSGFGRHAFRILEWLGARDFRPDLVTGHSLGGAAAGIIAADLDLAAITFGTPRQVVGLSKPAYGHKVVNVLRTDDPVTGVPWWCRHIGVSFKYRPIRSNGSPADRHRIHTAYIPLLEGRLPAMLIDETRPPRKQTEASHA